MFSFSAAIFFTGAFAVIVPVMLHFLKKRPSDRIPFPSFYFLRMINAAAKNRFNDMRKWLILILRTLAILFLCAAFALPFIPKFPEGTSEAAVIMVDASMSMKSRDSSPYIGTALKELDSLPDKTVASVCAVGDIPLWSGEFTAKKEELRDFIRNNCVSDASSSYNQALKQADALLKKTGIAKKNLILVSDMHKIPWAGMKAALPLAPDLNFKLVTAGKRSDAIKNVWIEDVKAYPSDADASFKAVVTAVNGSSESVSGILGVSAAGEKASRISVSLGPLEKNTFALDFHVPANEKSWGTAELDIPDELPCDNIFYFPLEKSRMLSVVINAPEKGGTDFLESALRPDSIFSCAEISYQDNFADAGKAGRADLFIIRNALSLDSAALENIIRPEINAGNAGLVLCWEKSTAMKNLLKSFGVDTLKSGKVGALSFGDINFSLPPFKIFMDTRAGNLFDISFYNVPHLKAPDDANVIASFSNGWPAVIELSCGKGAVYVLAFGDGRNSSDWPVRATFLPFWQELVKQFKVKNRKRNTLSASFKAFPVNNLKSVRKFDADGNETPFGFDASFTPKDAGVYRLENSDGTTRTVCVNHAPAESVISYMPQAFKPFVKAEAAAPGEKTAGEQQTGKDEEHGREFFICCLALALICGASELLLSNRTAL